MKVFVLLFDDFTALDVFGPVEALSSLEGADIRFVSQNGGTVENHQGLKIVTEKLGKLPDDAVLLIPGGFGTRNAVNDEAFIDAVRKAAGEAKYVLTVCTGSALLAKTGLLDGRKATGNKTAFDWTRSCGVNVLWQREPRWVSDGRYYISAGVSAGIDMAFGFIEDLYGSDEAERIASRMEYHRNRNREKDIF